MSDGGRRWEENESDFKPVLCSISQMSEDLCFFVCLLAWFSLISTHISTSTYLCETESAWPMDHEIGFIFKK